MEGDLRLTYGGVSRSESDTVSALFLSEPHLLISISWVAVDDVMDTCRHTRS